MIPEEEKGQGEEKHPVSWAEFLGEYPPGTLYPVKGALEIDDPFFNVATPDIKLYCKNQPCNGENVFKYSGLKFRVNIGGKDDYLLQYTCRNCGASQKTLAVHLEISSLSEINKAIKHGEQSPLWK